MAENVDQYWIEAIAKKVSVEPAEVSKILGAKGIHASPVIASPRRLTIQELSFSGVKTGVPDPGAFEFDWSNLRCGLWAMVADRNLRGKSSIIEIVKWLLRGRRSEGLQADVRSWLQQCRLRFALDEVAHEVRLETASPISGCLVRIVSQQEVILGVFKGESAFEEVMSDFFLRELALETVTRWGGGAEADGGRAVHHGWPSLSGAMFIGTNYSALFGDIPPDAGMTTPLMQMYLGLPWVSTLTAATTAAQGARRDYDARERARAAGAAERRRRRDEIQAELQRKLAERDATPTDEQVRAEIANCQAQLGTASIEKLHLRRRVERSGVALSIAEEAYSSDRRNLQAHIDSVAAGAVFRALDPSCCPRCDTAISDDRRKREQVSHNCSVCGEVIGEESPEESVLSALEARVKASKAARDQARQAVQQEGAKLDDVQERIDILEREITELSLQLAHFDARRQLDLEVAQLEARLQEAELDPESEAVEGPVGAVLTAAVDEVRKRVYVLQQGVLETVSGEIVRYARRFGMSNLSASTLKGNTHLQLDKGGARTTFSKCTAGEKLRLKVAAVLAMIREAERRHIGRHPGLLMIDSPGAQEVAPEDLDELIGGLDEVSNEFSHLQVFIASKTSDAVLSHVPSERMRYAKGDAFLW
jgi:hypothetical protein